MLLGFLFACVCMHGVAAPSVASTPETCSLEVEDRSPEDGAEAVALDAPVEVDLRDAVADAVLQVPGVPGHSEVDGSTVRFLPDAPWQADADVEVILSGCGDSRSWGFSTQSAPVEADLDGMVYAVALRDPQVDWGEPVGKVLAAFLAMDGWILQVGAEQPGLNLTLIPALADRPLPCASPLDLSVDFAADPSFVAGPVDGTLPAPGAPLPLLQLQVRGTFSRDGTEIEDLGIQGLVDVRPLIRDQDVNLCAAGSCVECPGSKTQSCVKLDLEVPEVSAWDGGDPSLGGDTCY